MKIGSFLIALSCSLIAGLPISASTLVHEYDLTSSLNDLVGVVPLISDGGTIISGSGYSFGANQGLNVSSALADVTDYSFVLDFSFQDLDGYRKIIDFKNLASDNGLYNLSTNIDYFDSAFGPSGALTVNTPAQVVLTRDAVSQIVTGYVDGVQQFSFTDTGNDATFTGSNGIIRFFEDDNVTGNREASAGLATQIMIYDGALNASQVAALNAAPEPGTMILFGIGIGALAGIRASKRN